MKKRDFTNFEKLIVGFLLTIVVLATIYVYIRHNTVDSQVIYLAGLLLSAFIVRKGLSYWKPTRYKVTSGKDNKDQCQNQSQIDMQK